MESHASSFQLDPVAVQDPRHARSLHPSPPGRIITQYEIDTQRHSPHVYANSPSYTWTKPAHGKLDMLPNASSFTASLPSVDVARHWGGTPVLDVSNDILPEGWMRFVHLDGSSYYFNTHHSVVTPEDILQPATYDKYWAIIADLISRLAPNFVRRDGWQTLVVRDFDARSGPTSCILDYAQGTYSSINARTPRSVPLDVCVEYKTERFWNALMEFPMHVVRVPRDIDIDFIGALSFGASERILEWNDTAYPFSDDQSRRLVQVYRDLKYDLDCGLPVVPAFTYHIARTMTKIEAARRKAQFGTYDAQLYRSVVSEDVRWVVKTADVFLLFALFGAHRMYRARLQNVRIRGEVYLSDFRELVGNFLAEWSDSNLLATVFVGANIAFLAVPNISNFQRTASLASTIFSVLSVATGVHHVWHHRAKVDASIEDAQRYMSHGRSASPQDSDLAVTAYFLSIPLVALLYAVLSFSVALAAFCVQSSGDLHGQILLSVVLGALGTAALSTLLFFWHVWRGPRTEEVSEEDAGDVFDYGWTTRITRLTGTVKTAVVRCLHTAPSETRDKQNV